MLIPVYKEKLNEDEQRMLDSVGKYFPYKDDIFFLVPQGLNTEELKQYNYKFLLQNKKFFSGTDSYSKMLLNSRLYSMTELTMYHYLVICQTDVLLLRTWDKTLENIIRKYDYIGAPWSQELPIYCIAFKGISFVKKLFTPQLCAVGNGGLSVRNIGKTKELLRQYYFATKIWNTGEDCFFAYYGKKNKIGFKIATEKDAELFAQEEDCKERIAKGIIPWGIHAWKKFYPEIVNKQSNIDTK